MTVEFIEWPKIPRGQNEEITITEKIDGTNGCIIIDEHYNVDTEKAEYYIAGVQSRKRIITPENDNFGFAAWVEKNAEDLLSLETGYHYGEWAGPGIQKNHHDLSARQFMLFNSFRWNPNNPNRPECCNTVPVLYEGPFMDHIIQHTMEVLVGNAGDGGWTPEGVIVWFHKSRRYEKHTFRTPQGKWAEQS